MTLRLTVGTARACGAVALFLAACSDSNNTANPSVDGGSDGAVMDSGTITTPPEGCDPNADPKDAPTCVVNDSGVFVDATGGADGNPGTKESPVKSITAALGKLNGKPRVYVCAGTYAESVHLTATASIYGGFACGDFSYTGAKPKIQPAAGTDYALDVAAANVTIEDVQLLGPELGAPNSIAVRAVDSAGLKFIRAHLEGRVGASGATGTRTDITNFPAQAALNATAKTGGSFTCPGGAKTTGGDGGDNGFSGAAGTPALGAGAGGILGQSCTGTGGGGDGAIGTSTPALGATEAGTITMSSWVATGGAAGATGSPGQGGGGGQGSGGGTGGGGGAGGCGGAGGGGGGGGGASIALLALNSGVTLAASELVTGQAGPGGAGIPGQQGQQIFGFFGTQVAPGCQGGSGGKGGQGGAGGGGAGGSSIAVVYKGTAPDKGDSMLTVGNFGVKGTGGEPGTNDGVDGMKADVFEVKGQ